MKKHTQLALPEPTINLKEQEVGYKLIELLWRGLVQRYDAIGPATGTESARICLYSVLEE